MTPDLSSKHVLLLGAETDLGRSIASALAEAGARLALVGASNDAETAFEVQRLARKVGAEISQAIDATNEMAVRVMVRQVSKALGGMNAVALVTSEDSGQREVTMELIQRHGGRELSRSGGGKLVVIWPFSRPEPGQPALLPAMTMDLRPPDASLEGRAAGQNWTDSLLAYEETTLPSAPADVVAALAAPDR